MTNREFIAAKDLPVTEAKEVNVLVVNPATGELAQKAGANLGGGGEQADLVITLDSPANFVLNGVSPAFDNYNVVVGIESGSLEAVVEAMRVGRPPVVKCKHFYVQNNFETSFPIVEGGVYDCSVTYYGGVISMHFIIPCLLAMIIVMNIDDPDYLEVTACPIQMTSPIQVI